MQPGVANVLLKVLDRFPFVFSWLAEEENGTFYSSVHLGKSEIDIDQSAQREVGLSMSQRKIRMRLVA
jgi:hypothetical protein